MLQSFIVYYSTLFLMLFSLRGCNREREYKLLFNFGIGSFVAIMLYTFVMGVRYGVGMDYFGYLYPYRDAVTFGESAVKNWEPAFKYLILALAKYKLHFSFFFASVAFLQMAFIFKAFRKNKEILPYLVLAFFAVSILSWQNLLRQMIAMPIFIYAIQFIRNRDWKRYYLSVILAFLFHKSAVLLVLVYPVFAFDWHSRKYSLILQNGLILASVAAGTFIDKIMSTVFTQLDTILIIMEYENYANFEIMSDATRGIGYYIKLIIVLIVVNLSNKVKVYYKNTPYSIFYTLFFLGYLFSNLITGSIILQRPNYYFVGLDFVVIAFTLAYLHRNMRGQINKVLFISLIGMLLILTFSLVTRGDTSTSRYFFFWDNAIRNYNFINSR